MHADDGTTDPLPPGDIDGTGGPATLSTPPPTENAADATPILDASTGAARSHFTFQLNTARGKVQPSLVLDYNSSSGPGFAGLGWSLTLPSIIRKGNSGLPEFTDPAVSSPTTMATNMTADDYVIDGQLLVPICTIKNRQCTNNTSATSAIEVFPAQLAGSSLDGFTYFRRDPSTTAG